MESTCVDTSLNLNVSPSRPLDVAAEVLVEELHRLSSENKRLTEKLTIMSESYSALQQHLNEVLNKKTNSPTDLTSTEQSRKRKAETGNCRINNNMFGFSGAYECSTITEEESFKRPKDPSRGHTTPHKVLKVLVHTKASDPSLYVRDGYQWRKYGQKVTRDNPSPRAYFRCSFAPNCPVKKKVQKSVEDPTVLVATYEGEHNHAANGAELLLSPTQSEVIDSDPMNTSAGTTITLDPNSMHQILVQQMASSLRRDPNFTSALATAISGRILDHTIPE